MARAAWSRPPGATTFTLTLSEDEARALVALADYEGETRQARQENPAIYPVFSALEDAAAAARVTL